jgi:YD repeat-containing protein
VSPFCGDRPVESYLLDIQDRPITVTNVEDQVMQITYSVGSMVESVTRFDGTVVSNTYDRASRLSCVTLPDSTNTFTYYDNALPKTVTDESGTVSNTYDQANRLISVSTLCVSAPLREISYSLDGIGNATNVLISVDGSPEYCIVGCSGIVSSGFAASGISAFQRVKLHRALPHHWSSSYKEIRDKEIRDRPSIKHTAQLNQGTGQM